MLNKLLQILSFVRQHLAYFIPIVLIAGLAKGHYYPMAYSRLICISALLIMIFPIFINLEIGKGLKELPKFKGILLLATIVNFVLYPIVAYVIGWFILQNHPAMWLGLIMLSLIPTSGMTINWTYFTKGNMHIAMGIVSISIILSVITLPFVIPFVSQSLMGTGNVIIDKDVILEKLFFVIVLPVIFGTITRFFILKFKGQETFKKIKPFNAGISAIGVLFVSFLVMSLESTQTMIHNIDVIFIVLIPVVLFYLVIFFLSHFIGGRFLKADYRKPFFFGTAARYHVITLGVALGSFKEYDFVGSIVIVIAIGLAIQIPALAFYAKYLCWKESKSTKAA